MQVAATLGVDVFHGRRMLVENAWVSQSSFRVSWNSECTCKPGPLRTLARLRTRKDGKTTGCVAHGNVVNQQWSLGFIHPAGGCRHALRFQRNLHRSISCMPGFG